MSSGAPGFCLSHNVTLEEEAGRASCTFLPPLRLSSSPPTPSSSGTASCRHLHNKSPQVSGGERAGRVPVTRAPRRRCCSADPSEKQSRHPELNRVGDPASQPAPLATHSRCPLGPATSPLSPFASLVADLLLKGEVKRQKHKKLNPSQPDPLTSGRYCLGQQRRSLVFLFAPGRREIPATQKVPFDGQSLPSSASRHLPSRVPARRGAQRYICACGAVRKISFVPHSQPAQCLLCQTRLKERVSPAHPIPSTPGEFSCNHWKVVKKC